MESKLTTKYPAVKIPGKLVAFKFLAQAQHHAKGMIFMVNQPARLHRFALASTRSTISGASPR